MERIGKADIYTDLEAILIVGKKFNNELITYPSNTIFIFFLFFSTASISIDTP